MAISGGETRGASGPDVKAAVERTLDAGRGLPADHDCTDHHTIRYVPPATADNKPLATAVAKIPVIKSNLKYFRDRVER